MKRRNFLKGASLAAGTLPAFAGRTIAQKNTAKTLRIIHNGNLASLDPIWTTAPPTKDYAFLTFDQLLAVDSNYVPHPQMAEGWTVEADGKAYVLGLRDGLKFHDGEPVRSSDCIASSQCFIMPERMAKVDPVKQLTETIGSGPYRLLKSEFVSGARAAWAKFDGYIPRKEPVDSIAGGRIPAVDRIEWSFISDPSTAMAALVAGEQDYWDAPTLDLVPVMKADPNIVVSPRNPTGSYYMLQLNHMQPPFSNPKVRQALAMAVDQTQFLKSAVSDPALFKPCYGYYRSDSPYSSEDGADVIKIKSIEKARAALKEAGYAGEKVVILAVMENPTLGAMCQVAEDLMRSIGMNVQLVAMDFATMAQRRTSKEPTDKS